MKKTTFLLVAALTIAMGQAVAAPVNLLKNGSFETGDFTDWISTSNPSTAPYPAKVVSTPGTSPCCFGESVPASTILGGSPDAAGLYGVYFVDDNANQSLTQSIYLAAGAYEVGFDAYVPQNGYNNPGDAMFSGTIANVLLADFSVKDDSEPKKWVTFNGLANIGVAGFYSVGFNFITTGGASADVVIDRAYIVASENGGGTPIPEPGSLALLGLGLAGLGFMRRACRV